VHHTAPAAGNDAKQLLLNLDTASDHSVGTVMATLNLTICASPMTPDCDNVSISNHSISMMSDVEALMNDVIGIWITGCICLLGVAGNILSFIVLKRAFGVQSPMFHVLRAMSVSDSVFLLAVFTVQSAVNAYQYFGLHHVIENYRGYVQYGVWPLLMTTQVREIAVVRSVSLSLFRQCCKGKEKEDLI